MFEDSMKNAKAAKALGLKTVLLLEQPGTAPDKAADKADANDEAIDVVLGTITELKGKIPSLWQRKWTIEA